MKTTEALLQDILREKIAKRDELQNTITDLKAKYDAIQINTNNADRKLINEESANINPKAHETIKDKIDIIEKHDKLLAELHKLDRRITLILERKLLNEFIERQKKPEPDANPNTQFVLPLSARFTSLRRISLIWSSPIADVRQKKKVKTDFHESHDDLRRILKGMERVIEITKKRLNKETISKDEIIKHGPLLIYNGLPIQNHDLQWLLLIKPLIIERIKGRALNKAEKIISQFPVENLRILPLAKDARHTKGQLESLRQYVYKEELTIKSKKLSAPVSKMPEAQTEIISDCYHTGRVDRMDWSKDFTLVSVGNKLNGKDSRANLAGELDRIIDYSDKGDIAINPYTLMNDRKEKQDEKLSKEKRMSALYEQLGTIGDERNVPSIMTPRFKAIQQNCQTMISKAPKEKMVLSGFDDTYLEVFSKKQRKDEKGKPILTAIKKVSRSYTCS